MSMTLSDYDIVVINSSAGKDSLCCLFEINRLCIEQGYPKDRVYVSHQDLGRMEWIGTRELAEKQAEIFGFNFEVSLRRTKDGREESLLEYVRRRGKWPSNKQRYCTSDYKRGPGARVITKLSKAVNNPYGFTIPQYKKRVLQVFGFRADESPSRKKKDTLSINERLTTKMRIVTDWLPIHDWSVGKVWSVINSNDLPFHWAYKLGMPRLSCCFCIFSPFDALVISGIHNRDLLDEYIQVEDEIGHTFRADLSLHEVRDAINFGYVPKQVSNWIM